ncbi:very short patch repair endonuclease [Achromobacter mucicolens]|uniref:very short patch repair endonuclease n=1 Tax=Achromobacter mucicolens TaxID=1389922 RepID=UPI0015830522|nr:very short patch repair endonuclease [Achromobacter mucicolens]
MDIVSPDRRSRMMAGIRGKDTKPEIVVRKLIHSMGFRFRLHRKDLPGSPDLVFSRKRKVIFVHGCFWHRHTGCRLAYTPKSNVEFWRSKFDANMQRDSATLRSLANLGWKALVVWECELAYPEALAGRVYSFLSDTFSEVSAADVSCSPLPEPSNTP